MNRFASTRSEKRASQPFAGRAQCRLGSIEDEGIRYGFTTHALIASTIRIAPAIVTTQSTVMRSRCGRPRVSRSTGLRVWYSGLAVGGSAVSYGGRTTGAGD